MSRMLIPAALSVCLFLPLPAQAEQQPGKDQAGRAEDAELWFAVKEIVATRCLKCHDGPDSSSGIDLSSYEALTRKRKGADRDGLAYDWPKDPWAYITPGKPADSFLLYMVQTSKMPLGESALEATEKLVIKGWIEKGAPPPPVIVARPHLSRAAELQAIRRHLEKLPAADRSFQRYLSLTHLHNNGTLFPEHLGYYRASLAKLVNSLSWEKELVGLTTVPETHDAVLAFDLRQVGWQRGDLWRKVLASYPYAVSHDRKEAEQLLQLTEQQWPVVRGDWFAEVASRPPLYHELLELPATEAELESRLGVSFLDNFRKGNLARAGYLGASTTTSGYRVSERQPLTKHAGAYWKSYDFGLGLSPGGRGNPLAYPLGPLFKSHPAPDKAFIHQGSEVIFSLPNGLQGYMVLDGKGQRMNEPPTAVLKDKNEYSGTPALANGISCMACHRDGINNLTDQVRREAMGRKFPPETQGRVEKLYPEKEAMDRLLRQDKVRFLKALGKVTNTFLPTEPSVPLPKTELIHALAVRYRDKVDLTAVATELDYPGPEPLRQALQKQPEILKGLNIKSSLMEPGGRISRAEWSRVFRDVVRRLERGTVVLHGSRDVRDVVPEGGKK